jgi:hypothetical protein
MLSGSLVSLVVFLVVAARTNKQCIEPELFKEKNVIFQFWQSIVRDGVQDRMYLVYNTADDELVTGVSLCARGGGDNEVRLGLLGRFLSGSNVRQYGSDKS